MAISDTNVTPAILAAAEEGTPLLPSHKGRPQDKAPSSAAGSSVLATVFNLTNSIVGAGCIALGSAIGKSGGLVSILAIACFAALNKKSYDLVIDLSREAAAAGTEKGGVARTTASYEALGRHACGRGGLVAVTACKLLYSYGSLVVYIKIIKDNFPSGLVQLYSASGLPVSPLFTWIASHEDAATVIVGLAVVFPICLLRDMSAMERCSIAKVAIIFVLIGTMLRLMSSLDYADRMDLTFQDKWLVVRPGFTRSLGSFVFTFVSQHTINLTYESLRPELQTMDHWRSVSSLATLLATIISMALSLVLYTTFWTDTSSDIFSLYPSPSAPVAVAKILLSVMIMFTYPVTFLACRELCTPPPRRDESAWWLLDRGSRQLIPSLHATLTFLLWASTTALAILAPSLLDVIDLVGAAMGTAIAFVLPGLFACRMRGPTALAGLLLVVGGSVGVSGTWFSLTKLMGAGGDR